MGKRAILGSVVIAAIVGVSIGLVGLARPGTARAGFEFVNVAQAAGIDVGSVSSFGDPCVADLNGDGVLDLVIDRHKSGPWDVYHGRADGGYLRQIHDEAAPDSTKPVPGRKTDTHGCASGDVDRDGDIDLIGVEGACEGRCFKMDDLWLNDGATWSLRSDLLGPTNRDRNREGLLVDLNADGWLDYVTVAAGYQQISAQRVYWNNGSVNGSWGGFTQQVLIPASGSGTCVDAHDVNGDGNLDIVMCGNRGLLVFNGPTFQTRQFYNIADLVQVDFADVDDSNAGTEILLTRQSALEIRPLDLTRTITVWPLLSGADSAVLDIDADGDDDIYLIQGLSAQAQGSLGSHFLLLRESDRWVRTEVPQPARGAGSHVTAIPGYAGGDADAALVLNGGENRLTRQWDRKGPRQLVVRHATNGGTTTTTTIAEDVGETVVVPGGGVLASMTVTARDREITSSWSHPTATQFQFRYQRTGSATWTWDPATAGTLRVLGGLTNGTSYTVAVRIYANRVWNAWNTATVTPRAPIATTTTTTTSTSTTTTTTEPIDDTTTTTTEPIDDTTTTTTDLIEKAPL